MTRRDSCGHAATRRALQGRMERGNGALGEGVAAGHRSALAGPLRRRLAGRCCWTKRHPTRYAAPVGCGLPEARVPGWTIAAKRRCRARPTGALLGGGRPDHAPIRGADRGAARRRRTASRRAGSAREWVRATATTARHRSSTARVRGRCGVRTCPGGRAARRRRQSGTASRASGFTTTWTVMDSVRSPLDGDALVRLGVPHGTGGWRLAAPPQAGDLGRRTAARPCGAYRARGILGTIIPARAAGAARTDRRGTMTQPAETLRARASCAADR